MFKRTDGGPERVDRLREAVHSAGGPGSVARRAGMPLSTLSKYLAGREMRLPAAVAIARATGVRLEWLATGEGPMRPDATAPPPAPPPSPCATPEPPGLAEPGRPAAALGLTWQADPDRLARAYEMALAGISVLPGHRPDPRRLMRITLLLYDELAAAEGQDGSSHAPDA
jgi:DNA-binding phage protein